MSDVVLICPPGSTSERIYTICEAAGVSAVLKANHYSVDIVDCNYSGYHFQPVIEQLQKTKPLLLAFVFQWESYPFRNWTRQLLQYVSQNNLRSHFTAVGRGATVCCESILETFPFFQSIIYGESEKTAIELLEKFKKGDDWTVQRGIALKVDGRIIKNPAQTPILNLDTLPFSDRDYLQDRRMYPVAPMHSSRYCYGSCNFCVNRVYRNATHCEEYRARSAELVVEELQNVKEKYGTKTFCFVDNNFLVDGKKGVERALKIAELLIEKNIRIRFHAEFRVNDIEPELFKLLKKAGLRKVFLGIESGSQSVLDRYQKETTVEANKKSIQILKELHISYEPGFIMFDPLTTFSEFVDNVNFLKETELYKTKSSTGSPLFNSLNMYQGASIEKLVPDNLWLSQKYEAGRRPYRVKDQKVQAIREMMQLFEREFYRHQEMMMNSIRERSENDNPQLKQESVVLQKQLMKFQDNRDRVGLDILTKMIEYLNIPNGLPPDYEEALKSIINDELTKEYNEITGV